MKTFSVTSGNVRLHYRVWGDANDGRPTLVLVHGFPDNSLIWEPVAARLGSRYRIVAPDVRGAGLSDAPARTADYRMDRLVEDLRAVLDAVSPDRPVHLAGHDWGSIQCWEAVATPALQGRIASFTSISGPSLDHAAFWIRETVRRRDDPARLHRVLNQLAHSWYIASFHLPLIPRLTWRLAFDRWPAALVRRFPRLGAEAFATQGQDGLQGIRLYRANFIERLLRPEGRWTDAPVQLIVPCNDRFVTPGLFDDLHGWAPRLWRRDVAADHWVQTSHPDLIAGYLQEFIAFVESGVATRALDAARVRDTPTDQA